MNFWNKIRGILFGSRAGKEQETNGPSRSSATMRKMMRMLEMTREEEYSCEEVHTLLDQYVEAVVEMEDSAQLMPLVKHHIELCPDCREELEALLRILEAGVV